jgi:Immunity protein 27
LETLEAWKASEAVIDGAISRLEKRGHDSSGWNTLYRDPRTNEFWEVTYPHGEMHGGGPRKLSQMSLEEVRAKYPALVS